MDKLSLIYNEVYVPTAVESEFLSKSNKDSNEIFSFLLKSYSLYNWFFKCNTFDEFEIRLLSMDSKMHKGEIEVIAQTKKLAIENFEYETLYSGIDESYGRKIAKTLQLQTTGVLKTLAKFHFLGIIDYYDSVKVLLSKGKRFSKSIVDEAFKIVELEITKGSNNVWSEYIGKKNYK